MWWIHVACFAAGFFLGALVLALCAIAKCSDCEIIARIWRGGKQ